MSRMFNEVWYMESLDLRSFNTKAATNMTDMFGGYSYGFNTITLGKDFSFTGNGSTSCTLPTDNGSTQTWYLLDGTKVDPVTHTRTGVTTYTTVPNIPMMKSGSEWYKGGSSSGNIDSYSKIIIQDDPYTGSGALDSWEADIGETGSIMCYDMDSHLIIAGNGSGKIRLNPNSSYMFATGGSVVPIEGLEVLDTSEVTNMEGMFYYNASGDLDLSDFDTSKVTNMSYMFHEGNVGTLDLRNFDTSKVTYMENMFHNIWYDELILGPKFAFGANSGIYSNYSRWYLMNGTIVDPTTHTRTSVTTYSTSPMLKPGKTWLNGYSQNFAIENNITIQTTRYNGGGVIDSWPADVGETGDIMCYIVEDALGNGIVIAGNGSSKIYANPDSSYMFESNDDTFYWVTEISGLNNLDTSRVTNMSHMFEGIYYLERLDLSSWDTRNVTNMDGMFNINSMDTEYFTEIILGPNFRFTGNHGLLEQSSTWELENGTQVDPTTHTRTGKTTYYTPYHGVH